MNDKTENFGHNQDEGVDMDCPGCGSSWDLEDGMEMPKHRLCWPCASSELEKVNIKVGELEAQLKATGTDASPINCDSNETRRFRACNCDNCLKPWTRPGDWRCDQCGDVNGKITGCLCGNTHTREQELAS